MERDMTDQQKSAETTSRLGWIATILMALIFGAIGGYAIRENKGVDISLGNFKVTVAADETFAQLLNKASEKDPKDVEAILASRQYYNLTDANLVDQLEHLDASKPETQEISLRLRRLLWDLRGPFKIPDTLSGADERMMEALDALEKARENEKKVNPLLVALWRESLEGGGVFVPRTFNATIEVVPGAPAGDADRRIVLVCPGSAVALVSGVLMSLQVGDSYNILADVTQNPSLFPCSGPALTAAKLLEGDTVRLGLSEKGFKELVPAGGIGNERINANFILYPEFMVVNKQ
jgi:hypothetical protein